MARGQHTRDITTQGNSSNVKLAAGLLSDNVPTSFSNMEWCFQENKDYASMHRKQSQNIVRDKRIVEGDQDNSKSESRSEEEVGAQRSTNHPNEEQFKQEPKRRGFAIQIKNNDPIIFDDDSVSTLTHYDRRSSRKESGDLSDMLGPFGSTSRIIAAEAEANRIQEGEALVYNSPSETDPIEQDTDEAKASNQSLSRQQKLNRAKHRFHGKVKEMPSLLSVDSSASTSFRSAKSESIAQRVAMFEKPNNQKSTPVANTKPIQAKKKALQTTPKTNVKSDQTTPAPTKPSMGARVPENTAVVSKRPSLRTCLKNGTSERSARSISSCLKNGTSDKSEKSTRSVTFMDEDTELGGSHRNDPPVYDIPPSDSNLSASECKKSLSLKYKKSRVSKEEKKLNRLNDSKRNRQGDNSGSNIFGCPLEFNFDFDFDDVDFSKFDIKKFDIRKFDISMLLSAFDFVGRNKCYNLTPSFDEYDEGEEKEGETLEEAKEEILGREIATEFVEFPQPRWSKDMIASE
ncbi:unnamed protein product [Cylindrotheca closterium]|uniref:Uncharacterized protein n=1 Tax=Cylindrotheca closterium TaxID=2856 RepID=A0AAD2CKR2_9STRA|nr:unnamed protein product [Cylindrotheca closterium]